MTAHKDVVVALLGGSGGLAGLGLVFLGIIIATVQSFDGATPRTVKDRYRRVGLAILIAFGLGMVCVSTATIWLPLSCENRALYVITVAAFFLQIAALAYGTVWTVRRVLWEA